MTRRLWPPTGFHDPPLRFMNLLIYEQVGGSSVSHHEHQRPPRADVAAPGSEQHRTKKVQELPRKKIVPLPGEVKIPRTACRSSVGSLPEAEWALERDRQAHKTSVEL